MNGPNYRAGRSDDDCTSTLDSTGVVVKPASAFWWPDMVVPHYSVHYISSRHLAHVCSSRASYQASNAYVKLKRHLLDLEALVRVQLKGEWKQGNLLHDWYKHRGTYRVTAMELRKEHQAPLLHQYIVFKLGNGSFFRIDRRQLPDDTVPLDCIYEQRVKAFSTIEYASHSPSDRLIGIYFRHSNWF
ncbi:unnamed protein product [Rhizoctonia solani]|uniref:Uncharacterized protein n=1 Tax=Rhizoctonia solani TaxID=456999 RepID=A0A8H3B0T1_9AGAM|nr:unnamed protein product [Rhizoctonia solani]CAE7056688.1 unnamed protein product [Rhizoctonia solani]